MLRALLLLLAPAVFAANPQIDPANISLLEKLGYSGQTQAPPVGIRYHIDDSLFRLSPGDVLKLRWWGVGSGDVSLIVNPQNEIVVPDLGVVRTGNLAFGAVRDSLYALLRRKVNPKMVDLQIQSLTTAIIGVSGVVRRPGVLEVDAGTRLSTVTGMTGWDIGLLLAVISISTPKVSEAENPFPSVRAVRLIRGPRRDTMVFDLAKSFRKGDPRDDPRLYSGDQVEFLPQGPVIAISGGPPMVGYAEYVPGETIRSFLKSIGAREESPIVGHMASGKKIELGLDETMPEGLQVLQLGGKSTRERLSVIWVRGNVKSPGVYPFREGLKAKELVAMAGGYTVPDDSVILVGFKRDWPLLLQGGRRPPESQQSQVYSEGTQYPELRVAIQEQMLRASGSYSSADPQLQPGDTLDVRMVERVVWVGGQVGRPGFVPWVQGASIDDYVRVAGGYGDRPWKSKIRIEDLNTHQIVRNGEIRPGTAIIVPERKYIYLDQWITVAATTASLLVSTMALYFQIKGQ